MRFFLFLQILPFLPVLNTSSGTTEDNKQPEKSGNLYIFKRQVTNIITFDDGLSHTLINFCAFLCVLADLAFFFPVLYTSLGTTGDNKEPGKSGNYNIYSNG